MSRRAKRLARLRQNPQNASFQDLRRVLEDYGFVLDRVIGSHYIFYVTIGGKVWRLTVPLKKPHLKAVYVKEALKIIDEIIALLGLEDEADDFGA
jgi:predicted RNA binding protein YcfA (HicA-like mRNA interferase family)